MSRKSRYTNHNKNIHTFYAGMYLRLSRDDGDKMESESISSQRSIIEKFILGTEDIVLVETYIDDGFSGTSFNRPDFRRMEKDWQDKKINCIIVKDLSRFGRDYIDVGNYLERVFPVNDIRFIAVNDGYDNYNGQSSDNLMIPVKNVFNGYYAKDIQKKVNSALDSKRREGLFIGSFASYGYKRDPLDKHKLIIDKYPAMIVRRIFSEYSKGKGQIAIARKLNDENILCPSAYKESMGLKYKNSRRLDGTAYWTYATVHRILKNQIYIGDMVQGKTYRKVMRGKASIKDKDDWIIVKGTHQPIIDGELWESVQRQLLLDTRNVKTGDMHIFAGLIVCGDCKRAMSKNKTKNAMYYVCSSNKRYGKCTRHSIKYDIIYNIVLNDINKCIESIVDLEKSVDRNRPTILRDNNSADLALKSAKSEYIKVKHLKKGLYEDYREGIISKEEYIDYCESYTNKENSLHKEIETLEADKSQNNDNLLKISEWIFDLIKYKRLTELDRDIVLKMVDIIEVYENNHINIIYKFSDELDSILSSSYQMK